MINRPSFPALTLAAAVALIPVVALAAPEAVSPAAAPIRVEGAQVSALRDARNVVPNDNSVFGVDQTPQAVAAVLRAADAPTDRITLSVDALLVRTGGHVALIDTGLGPKANGVLIRSLALAGVKPAQVTDVLITHSHPDHIGGLLDTSGGLAFPNATIRMSAPEWETLQAKGDKAMVTAVTPRVQAFLPGAMVLPHIASVSLPGHTPGHVGYRIGTGKDSLFDIGDTAHSSIVSLAHPEWKIDYDGNEAQGRAQRERLLAQLASSGARVWAPHFPFPGAGTVVKRGTGYAFVPAR